MTKKPKAASPHKAPVSDLRKQVAALTEQRDLAVRAIEQDVRERVSREILGRACRGVHDRAAVKCLLSAHRELCSAVEALVRGSET